MSETDTPIHEPTGGSRPDLDGGEAPRPPRELTSGAILGDFRIERLIGRGGMGEVYLAHQLNLDRPVALKILKPEMLANPTYRARFEKEAQSAAKLNHPNIVHIYNTGSIEGRKYIAMEYVQGSNLKEYMAKKGSPEVPQALSIMRQAGLALSVAGEEGLVHRDIKPENLLLTKRGQVKVADFGLCRQREANAELDLTQEGVTLGTPLYMSPEQVQGKALDHRSDLYSLGVTFYHMLSGLTPFKGETALAVALKHVQETPIDLAVHRPDLPAELTALVMKLMAKKPDDRYPNAAAMLRELARIKDSIAGASMSLQALPVSDASLPASGQALASTSRASGSRIGQTAASGTSSSSPSQATTIAGLPAAPGVTRGRLIAVCLLAVALGGLAGSRGRVEARVATRPSTIVPPALWLAPWESVPKQKTAEAQYRFAQMASSDFGRDAAWLAVPGHFPTMATASWSSQAYIQLVRCLLRQRDRDRLDALALALDAWPRVDRSLPRLARAGASALRDDVDGVLRQYEDVLIDEQRDPALNELSYEILQRARRRADRLSSQAARLKTLEEKVAEALQLQPLVRLELLNLSLWNDPASRPR
jgi:serine/threonine-protein kinase